VGFFFGFGLTRFLPVRVLPAGSLTLAVRRSDSLCLRLSTRRSALGSLSLTVFLACAATLKAFAFSLIRRRLRATETGLTVLPDSLPVISKSFAFATRSLSGRLAGIRLAASLSVTSVLAPK